MRGTTFLAQCAELELKTFDPFIVILGSGANKLSQIEGNFRIMRIEQLIPGNIILEMRIKNASTPIPNPELYTAIISVHHITALAKPPKFK